MKYKFLWLSLFATVLFIGAPMAFATSGECSNHGGVNCSAGASADGNVVCNDGYLDSSVAYSDVAECRGPQQDCTEDQMNALRQQYDITNDVNQITNLQNQIATVESQAQQQEATTCHPGTVRSLCIEGIEMYADEASGKIKNLQNQIAPLQDDMTAKEASIAEACSADGYQNTENQEYAQMQQEYQSAQQMVQASCNEMNGYIVNGQCQCAARMTLSTLIQCVSITQTSAPTISENNQPASVIPITSNLSIGASGPDVVTLQKFLEGNGYLTLPAGVAEGHFGLVTQQALVRYQEFAGLPASGYCGPMTRASINNSQ